MARLDIIEHKMLYLLKDYLLHKKVYNCTITNGKWSDTEYRNVCDFNINDAELHHLWYLVSYA